MIQLPQQERFLRLSDVMHRTGLSRSSIYLAMSKGEFPQSINLGARSVGWLDSEIDNWIESHLNERKLNQSD